MGLFGFGRKGPSPEEQGMSDRDKEMMNVPSEQKESETKKSEGFETKYTDRASGMEVSVSTKPVDGKWEILLDVDGKQEVIPLGNIINNRPDATELAQSYHKFSADMLKQFSLDVSFTADQVIKRLKERHLY